jgi:hypothetical protein
MHFAHRKRMILHARRAHICRKSLRIRCAKVEKGRAYVGSHGGHDFRQECATHLSKKRPQNDDAGCAMRDNVALFIAKEKSKCRLAIP